MHYRTRFPLGLILAGLVLAGSILNAQVITYTFMLPETVPPSSGEVNVDGVASTGSVTFDFINNEVGVSVTNTTDGSIFDTSYITGFYILKPWDDPENSNISYALDTTQTLIDGILNTNWGEINDGANNDAWNGLEGMPNQEDYFFFGAEISNNPPANGIGMGEVGQFLFELSGSDLGSFDTTDLSIFDVANRNSEIPHIIVRFQELGLADGADEPDGWDEDGRTGGSAKGWGYFIPPEETPEIPEPSEIALLSLLGLGGLLVVRRRFRGKPQKN